MNNEFIPYEQALELKELGFNQECLAFYNSTFRTPNELLYPQYGGEVGNWNVENHLISAPLYQQAFRWFREKHQLFSFITTIEDTDYKGFKFTFWIAGRNSDRLTVCDTYEEAELACLKKLIEIVKIK
jgi:hypothetical protein